MLKHIDRSQSHRIKPIDQIPWPLVAGAAWFSVGCGHGGRIHAPRLGASHLAAGLKESLRQEEIEGSRLELGNLRSQYSIRYNSSVAHVRSCELTVSINKHLSPLLCVFFRQFNDVGCQTLRLDMVVKPSRSWKSGWQDANRINDNYWMVIYGLWWSMITKWFMIVQMNAN